jgi:UDP-2,4-diacetamido-2,4,6-trideoxy-beta-L-altropyranose hydrolase
MNFAFRIDASKVTGIGHLMRCLALTEELKRRRRKCHFLIRTDEENIIHKIENYQAEYHKIVSNRINEVNEVIKILKDNNINWIFTDSYDIDSDYIRKLKIENFKVLSIDDNALIHYFSDVVVNQNIGAEKLDFSSEKYTKFLLGTKYVMMRDELLKREEKKYRDTVEKLLITFGGADKDNFTLEILKSLESINENIEVIVILGPFNQFYDRIYNFIKDANYKAQLNKSPENMTDIYLQSDIAISAGGTSCYELAYFGIPNIIITIAKNQLRIAKELDNQELSIYLGHKGSVSNLKIKENVNELIKNHNKRKTMSENGMKIVDGKGKHRVIDFVERI